MIEVQDLYKSFGKVCALDGLSFRAEPGAITGLIGHNGAGKTTTFRVLGGLLKPDHGTGNVDGFDCVTDRLEAQKILGILPDVRGLYPRLTGREHIHYYGELRGWSGDALEARVDELITRLGMSDFADRRARGYSRGQELKIALGRALIHSPKNLILDEPTNGLDVVSSHAVHDLIREMRDDGATILISSHIMAEVSLLCDHIIIIADGRAIMEGSPDELLARTGSHSLEDIFLRLSAGLEAAE